MRKRFFGGVAACAALSVAAHAQDVDELAEIYGRLPSTAQLNVSPDGDRLARRVPYEGRFALRIDALDGTAGPVLWRPSEGTTLGEFSWTGDGTLLVMTEKLTATESYSNDPKSGRSKKYLEFFKAKRPKVLGADGQVVTELGFRKLGAIRAFLELADPELVSGELPVFIQTENAGGYGDVFRPGTVSLTQNRYAFTKPPQKRSGIFGYSGDPTGQVTFATFREFGSRKEELYRRTDGRWKDVPSDFLNGYAIWRVVGENELIIRGGLESGVYRYDVDSAEITETLYEGPEAVRPLSLPDRSGLAGLQIGDSATGVRFIDAKEGAEHQAAEAAIGQSGLTPIDASHNGRIRLLAGQGEGEAPTYYVYDAEAKTLIAALEERPELAGRPRAQQRRLTYVARDGLRIEAYLSTPEGVEPSTLPLVVLPHGGPASRDTVTFDPWREYLVSLGYAVFQPNFRGLTGYGRAFAAAGYGEWGAGMQNDLVDGVDHLVASGDADPSRLAIVGASYGGYAALMGAVDKTPYRCVASVNGVTDLNGMLSAEQTGSGFDYWAAHIGRDRLGEAELARRSPLQRAADIDVPVLLIHGGLDIVVRKGQSAALEEALREHGKVVRTLYLERSGHMLEVEEERQRAFAEVGHFLSDCFTEEG